MEQIHQQLTDVFRNVFKKNDIVINRGTVAADIDNWDSITHLDLITAIEENFAIEITGFDVMGLQNVGDLLDLIQRKKEN